jgi:DNA-binding MarR family transcriptional regulator
MDQEITLLERLLLRATLLELGRIAQESSPLTLTQFFALMAAQRHAGGCTMGELAAETLLPRSTATSVVDRLVELGLARRRRDEGGDRRQVKVLLTPQGEALLDQVRRVRRNDLSESLSREVDLSAVVELLRGYVAALAEEVYPDGDYPPRLII